MSRMKDIATEALLEERGKDWGDPVITHTQIAKVWSGLLHRKLIADLEPHEVASMMSGLKLVRHGINPHNPDSLDDSDAYNEINRLCVQTEQTLQKVTDSWFEEHPALAVYRLPDDYWAKEEPPEEDDFPCCSQGEEWFEIQLPGFGHAIAHRRDEGPNE